MFRGIVIADSRICGQAMNRKHFGAIGGWGAGHNRQADSTTGKHLEKILYALINGELGYELINRPPTPSSTERLSFS